MGGFIAPEPTQITQAKIQALSGSQLAKKSDKAAEVLSVSSDEKAVKLDHNVRLYFDLD